MERLPVPMRVLPWLERLAGAWLDRLQGGLPVQVRWRASVGPDPQAPEGCSTLASGDLRRRLALQALDGLRALARARGLPLHGAVLTLQWLEGEPASRHLHLTVQLATPAPAGEMQALGQVLAAQLRGARVVADAGLALHLDCVGVEPLPGGALACTGAVHAVGD